MQASNSLVDSSLAYQSFTRLLHSLERVQQVNKMSIKAVLFKLFIVCFLSGCSNFSLNKFLYNLNQSAQKEQCSKDPALSCPEFETYETYSKKRKELEGK